MRLWTIQAIEFWEIAKERGVFRSDGRRITFRDDFGDPYRWMREQMKKRIAGYHGRYPIWLWVEKPDMRMIRWRQGGERIVRLEVEVPAERVLLSDFEHWHYVLNSWFLGKTEAECEAFNTEFKKQRFSREQIFAFKDNFPKDLKVEMMDSWGEDLS